MVRAHNRLLAVVTLSLSFACATGCSVYRNTVPGYCVGQGIGESRSDKEPINFLRLRQEPPEAYRLDERDVLGIYIEGVLGTKDEPPPVHFPEEGDDMPPAIGFPVPIREDGTISLPLIEALDLRGLTLAEAEQRIRYTYISQKILKPDRERIIVTLMRPRTYHVLVVREDSTADTNVGANFTTPQAYALAQAFGTTRRGQSYPIELKAYENDVLHALSESGGLPGSDARNEVIVLRGAFSKIPRSARRSETQRGRPGGLPAGDRRDGGGESGSRRGIPAGDLVRGSRDPGGLRRFPGNTRNRPHRLRPPDSRGDARPRRGTPRRRGQRVLGRMYRGRSRFEKTPPGLEHGGGLSVPAPFRLTRRSADTRSQTPPHRRWHD